MYRLENSNAAKKDIKNLSKDVQKEIIKQLEIIEDYPFNGEKLKGNLKGLYKYVFSFKGTEYRIAYEIFVEQKIILILMAGSRENFYKRLKYSKFSLA